MQNNITYSTDCKYTTAATLYSRNMDCFWSIIVNTLRGGGGGGCGGRGGGGAYCYHFALRVKKQQKGATTLQTSCPYCWRFKRVVGCSHFTHAVSCGVWIVSDFPLVMWSVTGSLDYQGEREGYFWPKFVWISKGLLYYVPVMPFTDSSVYIYSILYGVWEIPAI
jgi:hypothetical protein